MLVTWCQMTTYWRQITSALAATNNKTWKAGKTPEISWPFRWGTPTGFILTTMDCGLHSTLKSKVACSSGNTTYLNWFALESRVWFAWVQSEHLALVYHFLDAFPLTNQMFCAVWGMTFFTEPQLKVAAFKSWPTTVMHISPSSVTRSPRSKAVSHEPGPGVESGSLEKVYFFSTPFSIAPTSVSWIDMDCMSSNLNRKNNTN